MNRTEQLLKMAEKVPKDLKVPMRAIAIMGKSRMQINLIANPQITKGEFVSPSNRNVTGIYKATSEIRTDPKRNCGTPLSHEQIILSFVINKSCQTCTNQRGQDKLYRAIPERFRRKSYEKKKVTFLIENENIISLHYKQYLIDEGIEAEHLLFSTVLKHDEAQIKRLIELRDQLSTDPEEIINSLYEKEGDEQKIGKIDMDEDYVPEDVPKQDSTYVEVENEHTMKSYNVSDEKNENFNRILHDSSFYNKTKLLIDPEC
ncbi:MAG: hypothetical protein EZS28_013375 [Streblomastix strix]|uniref:Uncharacterized protein n=1 Tax=Streblomastix strix TaxID=222440 RepID=A0A5J4W8C7_9EUKA|nr:MAG: hypothetical protein EZS28_013375 [Streblomastix strix]